MLLGVTKNKGANTNAIGTKEVVIIHSGKPNSIRSAFVYRRLTYDIMKTTQLEISEELDVRQRAVGDIVRALIAAGVRVVKDKGGDVKGYIFLHPWEIPYYDAIRAQMESEGHDFSTQDRLLEIWERKRWAVEYKFGKIYDLYLKKVEKKGRTKEELDAVITWLTGYEKFPMDVNLAEFFDVNKMQINPNARLITGKICGVDIEKVSDPLVRKIRWMDKLVDELAQGKSLDKIMRKC